MHHCRQCVIIDWRMRDTWQLSRRLSFSPRWIHCSNMCDFITATLPHRADIDEVCAIAKSFDFPFTPIVNPHVIRQLHNGKYYFLTTRGHCDCGTVLGSSKYASETEPPPEYSRKIKKLRKKAWSDEKVDRWLAQKRLSRKRRISHDKEIRQEEYQLEAQRWLGFLESVLRSGHTTFVGLLLHCYSGQVETDRVRITRHEERRLGTVTADWLPLIEEDILYRITR